MIVADFAKKQLDALAGGCAFFVSTRFCRNISTEMRAKTAPEMGPASSKKQSLFGAAQQLYFILRRRDFASIRAYLREKWRPVLSRNATRIPLDSVAIIRGEANLSAPKYFFRPEKLGAK